MPLNALRTAAAMPVVAAMTSVVTAMIALLGFSRVAPLVGHEPCPAATTTASAAAAILLWPRLWDAIFDPVMGVLADRTNTRWGNGSNLRFEP